MTNDKAQNPNDKSEGKAWTSSNDKIQMTIEIQMFKCQTYLDIGSANLAMRLPRRLRLLAMT
jgi:hypothetical protein